MSLSFVHCERTVLFSVKRDLHPPLLPSLSGWFCLTKKCHVVKRLGGLAKIEVDNYSCVRWTRWVTEVVYLKILAHCFLSAQTLLTYLLRALSIPGNGSPDSCFIPDRETMLSNTSTNCTHISFNNIFNQTFST